ncbi:MAG: cytosine permease [Spirochaetales bacterium]|jgi:NCS1 family nucleobase:cation symporter-1|nr:cytosine permease [Spirochaetales bacterium]
MDNAMMKNPELLPTTDAGRKMSMADYIILWAGMTINIVGFSLGAQYYNGGDGLSALVLAIVIFVGYGLVTLMTVMIGDIGTTYGIPFAAYIRAPFGYRGATIAAIFRAVPALYWFGFLTWVGAAALNYMAGIIFPGFDNLNLMIVIFGILQIINAMFGLKAMAKFDWIAVPALGILFIAILVASAAKGDKSLVAILTSPARGNMSIAYAISGIAGGWITMSLNGSDLSRQIKRDPAYASQSFFKRNKKAFIGQFLGMTVVGALIMLVGMIAGIATGQWDLNEVCKLFFNSKIGLILAFIAIVFAQWSTNTAANLMPPTYILIGLFPKKLKFWSATIIAGIVGIAIMPWKIQSSGTFLVDVQVFISTFLGPIIGVMLADYFLIRKAKLNVRDLYFDNGQYRYAGGFNISAIAALLVGFALSFLNSNFGFFIALFAAPVVYVVLMNQFTLKKYDQKIGQVIEIDAAGSGV